MNKKLLILFFIYLVLEGALRKWFLPEYNNLLFLLKDIILILSFIYLLLKPKESKFASSFFTEKDKLIWIVFVLFILLFGLLKEFDNLTIIGWRYYLVSIPLIALVPTYFYKDLRKYAFIYLILALPVLLLGIYQYFNPQNSVINKYAWTAEETKIAVFGDDRPRITSTFSYITPYTVYLQTIALLCWIYIIKSDNRKALFITITILFLTFANLIMTGSRAPLLLSVILSLPFIYYYIRLSKNRLNILAIGIVLTLLSINLLVDPFNSFQDRTKKADDTDSRVYGALLTPYITLSTVDFIGSGLGTTFLGTRELFKKDLRTFFDEVNQDRVGVEVGIIGYLLFLFIKMYFLIKTFFLIRRVNNYEIKLWLWYSLTVQLSSVWMIPIFNSLAATYYFVAIGIYYLMRKKHIEGTKHKTGIIN